MDFRREALDRGDVGLADAPVRRRSPAILRLPALGLLLLLLGLSVAGLVRADERTRGSAVVRVPGTAYVRAPAEADVAGVSVAEGELVEADQLLARLAAPELDRGLALARIHEREAMIASLRAPRDPALERELWRTRNARADLELELEAYALRAPAAGRVASVRVDTGSHLRAGDIVVALAPIAEVEAEIQAYFPGPAEIQSGVLMRVDLGEQHGRQAPVWFRVETVSRDWIRADDPRAMTELSSPSGTVVVVRGALESAPPGFVLRDGMIGEAQLILRERSALRRGLEGLGLIHGGPR